MNNLTTEDFQVGTKFKIKGSDNVYYVNGVGVEWIYYQDIPIKTGYHNIFGTFLDRNLDRIEILEQPKPKTKKVIFTMSETQLNEFEREGYFSDVLEGIPYEVKEVE